MLQKSCEHNPGVPLYYSIKARQLVSSLFSREERQERNIFACLLREEMKEIF